MPTDLNVAIKVPIKTKEIRSICRKPLLKACLPLDAQLAHH